jgi:hypothetical protein
VGREAKEEEEEGKTCYFSRNLLRVCMAVAGCLPDMKAELCSCHLCAWYFTLAWVVPESSREAFGVGVGMVNYHQAV